MTYDIAGTITNIALSVKAIIVSMIDAAYVTISLIYSIVKMLVIVFIVKFISKLFSNGEK